MSRQTQPRIGAHMRRGFTLLELAIVLVVAGLVLGGIWYAVIKVREGMNVYAAEKQLVALVQHIRDGYLARANIQGDYTALTQTVAQMDAFPAEMKRNPNITPANCAVATPCYFNSPWDSSSTSPSPVAVASFDGTTVGNAGRLFRVQYINTPVYACIQLPTRFSHVSDDIKLMAVLINGTSYTPPVSVATAATACGSSAATLTFQFNLRN